tara:strand:+ start:94 stop:660 length:567 start_codon:yes stop_codon:yes gene_type:complete
MDEKLEKKIDETTEEKPEINDEISLEQKLKDSEEKTLRALAEIENQRRRFEKEIRDAFEFGGFNLAKETLSILDNLQRAKISIKNDEGLKDNKDLYKFLENIDIVEKDLISIFAKNKIKKIISVKEKFDPNLHQAMMEIEDETVEPGTIVQEIQPGYMYGDRLLRPSFVGVAKKIDQNNKEKEEKKGV